MNDALARELIRPSGRLNDNAALVAALKQHESDVERAGRLLTEHGMENYWGRPAFYNRPPEEVANEFAFGALGSITPVGRGIQGVLSREAALAKLGLPRTAKYAAPMVRQGKLAYHGSPHKFTKFADEAIGTGEGAQAYGYGHYFADRPGVAKGYRDTLSGGNIEARNYFTPAGTLAEDVGAINGRAIAAAQKNARTGTGDTGRQIAKQVADMLNENPGKTASQALKEYDVPAAYRKAYEAAAAEWGDVIYKKNAGHLYKTALKVQDENLLHWDKPLSEQPKAVRDVIEPLLKETKNTPPLGDNPTGAQIYQALSGHFRYQPQWAKPAQSSEALRKAGIKGIKYLDQGSRGAGEGTYNYVIFDPKDTAILETMGIGAVGLANEDQR